MPPVRVINNRVPQGDFRDALEVAADVLGVTVCWYYRGGFHFRLPSDWTVSFTPESAGRLRVETWSSLRLRDRKWARVADRNRVAALVRDAHDLALEVV